MGCKTSDSTSRDGTSRKRRFLRALEAGYADIDERSIADLLTAVQNRAKSIQYYGPDNKSVPGGDWTAFFEKDISFLTAHILRNGLAPLSLCLDQTLNGITARHNADEKEIKGLLKRIFDLIFSLASAIENWRRAAVGTELGEAVEAIISSRLKKELKRIICTYNDAAARKYLDGYGVYAASKRAEGEVADIDPDALQFGSVWILDESPNWPEYVKAAGTGESFFGQPAGATPSVTEAVNGSSKRLSACFAVFYDAQKLISSKAKIFFDKTIENWPAHEPHAALLIAFLKLFKYLQNDLNGFTMRHLDFYYERVLGFKPKKHLPDKAHLVFELARHVEAHVLKEGTAFKAGKDNAGKEIIYKIKQDTFLNKASVKEIKNVFIDSSDKGRIYSASVANSKDGKGAPLEGPEPKWRAFGSSQKKGASYLSEKDRSMDFASLGFAVSSALLSLAGGHREIYIKINTENISAECECYLTGEKGWIKGAVTHSFLSGVLTITVTLDEGSPAVAAFNPAVHIGAFESGLPALKVMFVNTPEKNPDFSALKDVAVQEVKLSVKVTGLKDLILQNDNGLIKPEKPFCPFGTAPVVGSAFYIGSKDVFEKPLKSLTIKLEWMNKPVESFAAHYHNYTGGLTPDIMNSKPDENTFKAKTSLLKNGKWVTDVETEVLKTQLDYGGNGLLKGYEGALIEGNISEYTAQTKNGFMKLELSNPPEAFGHTVFRDLYTKALIVYAKDNDEANKKAVPNEPYTPLVKKISIDYESNDETVLPSGAINSKALFYHVYPFGVKKETKAGVTLMPSFTAVGKKAGEGASGELYIGLAGLKPPQNITLLFQLAEGSADPEAGKEEVQWSYLSVDGWAEFDKKEVVIEGTNGLVKSGIAVLSMPSGASAANPLMPAGLHWIRLGVCGNTNAVCGIIDVHAQAAEVVFEDNGNDTAFLSKPIEAGTIAKPVSSDFAVKKTVQPYASSGGYPAEAKRAFNNRVSERLRHKGRGVSAWDYERLVLERFPSVYKAKCVNHSDYAGGASEFAPGFVTLVAVPDLRNKNAVNPLEPRVTAGTLDEIKTYLAGLITPFAAEKLKVLNPLYEKIRLDFKARFQTGIDAGYGIGELQSDLKKFLCPWAFEDGVDITFGGALGKSVIINFIEKLSYVDYVTDFKMFHMAAGEDGAVAEKECETAFASTQRSILVSSESHEITEIPAALA